jgi:hypothetical protein
MVIPLILSVLIGLYLFGWKTIDLLVLYQLFYITWFFTTGMSGPLDRLIWFGVSSGINHSDFGL